MIKNNINQLYRYLAFSAFLILSTNLPALTITDVGVSTISPCPSFCGGPGSTFSSDSDGGEGVDFAEVNHSNPTNGSGAARSDLSGPQLLPNLGVQAFSNSNSRVGATAAGMQSYSYTGTGSNFSLSVSLDGSLIDGSQPPDASLTAYVIVFTSEFEPFFSTDYGTMRFEGLFEEDILAETELNFTDEGLIGLGLQELNDVLNFSLATGDELYVWASLSGSGTRGGSADAYNSLELELTSGDLAGLGLAAIPVPAALPLFLSALGLTVVRVRK